MNRSDENAETECSTAAHGGIRGNYRTAAADAILSFMETCGDRTLTAIEIADALRADGHGCGLATVYRHLSRLAEKGKLQTLPSPDGKSILYRYSGACRGDHYHLLCAACGTVTHLSCDCLTDLYRHIGAQHGFHIDGSRTVFYGLCASCYRRKKQKNEKIPNGETV